MSAQRIRRAGVDPAVSHFAASVTRMRSGLLHYHLTSYVVSPRSVVVDCMLEEMVTSWSNREVADSLLRAARMAAGRLVPPVDLDQLSLFD